MFEHSEYYLVFISPAVYNQHNKVGDLELFIPLKDYATYNESAEFYADNAIYLSSLDAYKLPGLSTLPEDTLICIRYPSSIAGKAKDHQAHFANAKKILINILDLKIS